MIAFVLALALLQAALLLWTAVHFSEALFSTAKIGRFSRGLVTLAIPIAIAWQAPKFDEHRVLCTIGDCVILAVVIAAVRYWAVTKEHEEFALERELNLRVAAEAATAAQRARDEERIRAAAAALEAGNTVPQARAPRHTIPPMLRAAQASRSEPRPKS